MVYKLWIFFSKKNLHEQSEDIEYNNILCLKHKTGCQYKHSFKMLPTSSFMYINRGSYTSVHASLYLFNELRISNKMRGWLSIFSLFSST